MGLAVSSLLCLVLVFVASSPHALEVPPRPDGRVTDLTRTLAPQEIERLDRKLAAFERETTNQIAVLLIPSLGGDSVEDYSIRLAEKWKVGQKGKDNGVILLVVKEDRKVRLEVGYGLEGALPDAVAGSIIRNEIGPRFRNGQFHQGIDAGIDAVMAATRGEYKARENRRSRGSSFLPFLLVLAFLFFFFLAGSRSRKRTYYSGGRRGWHSGGGFFGGGLGGGLGGTSGGGGFSGGGGGFGGGGASGNW